MNKLKKAEDLYLRGFKSEYIKRRTNISIQSLLKQLLSQNIKYTKEDIIKYQIEYIRNKYTVDDVINAYIKISETFDNLEKASQRKEIICLGCCFGQYGKVFRDIIGVDKYNEIRNKCWLRKQQQKMIEKYGVSNIFDKQTFDKYVSEDAIIKGRIKRSNTMIERYGVEHPNQNKEICNKMMRTMQNTCIEKYGAISPIQNAEIAKKSSKNRQKTMMLKYGAANSVEVSEIRNKIFDARTKNNTVNTSKPEELLYELLCEKFGKENILRNKIIDERYPYHVDFYVKSLDLFIELNGDKCHNNHWFDPNNERDVQIVKSWEENMIRLEKQNNKKSKYRKYINTWTITDVDKRQKARNNKIHYLVFWDGSCYSKNKKQIPKLRDYYEWCDAGCPMPENWRKENTY